MSLAQLKAYNFMCSRCKKAQPMTVGRKKSKAGGWICLPCTKAATPRPPQFQPIRPMRSVRN